MFYGSPGQTSFCRTLSALHVLTRGSTNPEGSTEGTTRSRKGKKDRKKEKREKCSPVNGDFKGKTKEDHTY